MSEDRIQTEVTKHSLVYISEEMAVLLRKSAFSPNIRERADHSCALLDAQGRTIGQAEQIPVHVGSLPLGLKNTLAYLERHGIPQREGDMYVVNDPYISGTHLNDVTLIEPVYLRSEVVGYVANKAHHVDVGGRVPGSISPDATELYQEGLIMEPVKLFDRGKENKDVVTLMKSNSRQPDTTEGDLRAQIAANRLGEKRFLELVTRVGQSRFHAVVESIMEPHGRADETRIRQYAEGQVEGRGLPRAWEQPSFDKGRSQFHGKWGERGLQWDGSPGRGAA